jgi:hypothetical protein
MVSCPQRSSFAALGAKGAPNVAQDDSIFFKRFCQARAYLSECSTQDDSGLV